jgi:hypothetical protein
MTEGGPPSHASAHGQEGGSEGALAEGGLPRHPSAHGQEGGGGGTMTEGGPPRHASAHGQEGGGGGALTEGGQQPLLSLSMRLRGGGPDAGDASAHGQEGGGGGALTEGGPPRHASALGQEGGGEGALTEGGLRQAILDALKLQDDGCVKTSKVQAYVLETLGVELSVAELDPIIDEVLREPEWKAWHRALMIAMGNERKERRRAADAELQRQLPPECCIDEASLYKLENKECSALAWAQIYRERIDDVTQVPKWLEDQRRLFNGTPLFSDGTTRIEADVGAMFWEDTDGVIPSLKDYRSKAKRTPDSLPARFYRMMTGNEWDGKAHSYSKERKKYGRFDPDYQQRERERQQRKKRDYSKKKRPADDNARRQARRKAQREREKATLAASASAHGQAGGDGGALTEGGPPRHVSAHGQEGDARFAAGAVLPHDDGRGVGRPRAQLLKGEEEVPPLGGGLPAKRARAPAAQEARLLEEEAARR